MTEAAVELKAVSKHFPIRSLKGDKYVHAMDEVSFRLEKGESLALVGESGSGKTTTASVISGLYEKTSGELLFDGARVGPFRNRSERLAHKKRVQMIFQDPFASLNPTHRIRAILERPFLIHGLVRDRSGLESRIEGILEQVGLTPASDYLDRFPHELSGGQRQRVNIARTFAVEPSIVLADEPTSMLDVSIRMGVMNMMLALKEERGVSYLYITHDLAGARYMCGRIAVMYAGMIVEIGPTEELISMACHPYLRLLKVASPSPESGFTRERMASKGEIPSLIYPPSGCRFHPRCPFAKKECAEAVPAMRDLGGGHSVRCLLF